jgi:hypothetical protein
MPVPCSPTKSCSLGLQLREFCEKPADQSNDGELCKISALGMPCQGTKNHIEYACTLVYFIVSYE